MHSPVRPTRSGRSGSGSTPLLRARRRPRSPRHRRNSYPCACLSCRFSSVSVVFPLALIGRIIRLTRLREGRGNRVGFPRSPAAALFGGEVALSSPERALTDATAEVLGGQDDHIVFHCEYIVLRYITVTKRYVESSDGGFCGAGAARRDCDRAGGFPGGAGRDRTVVVAGPGIGARGRAHSAGGDR